MVIVHVSEVDIDLTTGMGRVEYHWKCAFENAGYEFIHIGPKEVGHLVHKSLFPVKSLKYYKNLKITPRCLIVHEAVSGLFVNLGIPCFLESHGVERRYWESTINGLIPLEKPSLKTRLLFPLWRLSNCDKGLRHAKKLLLINSDDKEFVEKRYSRDDNDIFLFKNGVSPVKSPNQVKQEKYTILINGTWIERKGTKVLIEAAKLVFRQKIIVYYLLIGTGKDVGEVLEDWPIYLRPYVKIVSNFRAEEEFSYLALSNLFVLPSYFEGQPLSLLQAMACGICCITTNCCGQKDIVRDGITGHLFYAGQSLELAELIVKCFKDRKMTKEIGTQAKEQVEMLTWKNVSEDLVKYVIDNI